MPRLQSHNHDQVGIRSDKCLISYSKLTLYLLTTIYFSPSIQSFQPVTKREFRTLMQVMAEGMFHNSDG